MDKKQILENLSKNLNDLNNLENEISMVELAIYEKSIEELKNQKMNELKIFFEEQAKFYNQKIEKYQKQIDKNVENYVNQINQLINIYDNLYVTTFKIMTNALNNQKIAVANIVTMTERLKQDNLEESEIQKTKNTIIACAEKKLNYAVIIDECNARIKWCTDDIINNIDEIFKNYINQLQVYNDNIFNKIKIAFSNIFFGKSSFKKFIENYELKYLKNIKQKNNIKILDIASTIKGVIKQMEITKKKIQLRYEKRVSA